MEKFTVVYADPPWKYGSKSAVNNSTGKEIKKLSDHYESLSTKEICELPVKQIVGKEACCFLWFTSAFGEDAYKVMRSWNFKPVKIIFVWEKVTKAGKTCQNVGPWTMGNYEYVLFGTKGAMRKYKKINNLPEKVHALRKKHSEKPEIVRNNIEALFGNVSRIELFAREQVPGWVCLGDNINGKDIKTDLLNIIQQQKG